MLYTNLTMKKKKLYVIKKFFFFYAAKFFFAKWDLKKPKKKNILVYDIFNRLDYLFDKNQYEQLFVRYEKINFYVIFYTIFKYGLKNLKLNYIISYIQIVSPKIVISKIDNNLDFFFLKNLYSKAIYICLQGSLRDNIFINECKKYYSTNSKNLIVDYFFILGKNDYTQLKKYINAKFIIHGSFNNNLFKGNNDFKKINNIIYLSQATNDKNLKREQIIIKKLSNVCIKSKINLSLFLKRKLNDHIVLRLLNFLKSKNIYSFIKIISREEYEKKKIDTYEILNKNALFVTESSTFGFEAISKKRKVIFLSYFNFPSKDYIINNYNKNGLFWTKNLSEPNLKSKIIRVMNYNAEKWRKVTDKICKNIIIYDPKNSKLKKILNKYKIKSLL